MPSKYAQVLAFGALQPGGEHEYRVEKLEMGSTGKVEIRFSWWKNGRFIPRPVNVTEDDLLELLKAGISNNVFSRSFRAQLRQHLQERNP